MAHWKFGEERSFGSISCRGKQMQSAWWFQKHKFIFQEGKRGGKTNPSFRLSLLFWPWLWNSCHVDKTMLDTYCICCGKAFEHFAIAVDIAVGWAFTNCPIQSRFLRRGSTTAELLLKILCPSVRPYALNNTRNNSNYDIAFEPTNCKISTKQFDPYVPLACFLN